MTPSKQRARMGEGPKLEEHTLRGTEVIRIASSDAAISLGLLQRSADAPRAGCPPILLVHGATLGAAVFDLPLPGYSLLAQLAEHGRNVYAADIRGFGRSRVCGSVSTWRDPFPSTAEAAADVRSAARAICAREQSNVLDVIGFSWGCIPAIRYATAHPEEVARLALYAPLYRERNSAWLDLIADPADRSRLRRDLAAYRSMTLADLEQRWNREIGNHDIDAYREAGALECVFQTLCAADRHALADGRPAFRCPTGPLVDLVNVFNGRRMYDATRITMPTLIIRGADDITATDADARALLKDIRARSKSYLSIASASHFLLLEKKRTVLYAALDTFFEPLEEPRHSLEEGLI